MPTLRDEEWRFTDLSPLTRLSFQPVRSATRLEAADIAHFCLDDAPTRLVFVDGIYAPQLSSQPKEDGVVVANLSASRPHAAQRSRRNSVVTRPLAITYLQRSTRPLCTMPQ